MYNKRLGKVLIVSLLVLSMLVAWESYNYISSGNILRRSQDYGDNTPPINRSIEADVELQKRELNISEKKLDFVEKANDLYNRNILVRNAKYGSELNNELERAKRAYLIREQLLLYSIADSQNSIKDKEENYLECLDIEPSGYLNAKMACSTKLINLYNKNPELKSNISKVEYDNLYNNTQAICSTLDKYIDARDCLIKIAREGSIINARYLNGTNNLPTDLFISGLEPTSIWTYSNTISTDGYANLPLKWLSLNVLDAKIKKIDNAEEYDDASHIAVYQYTKERNATNDLEYYNGLRKNYIQELKILCVSSKSWWDKCDIINSL